MGKLEESVAVRSHYQPYLKRIEAAVKLRPRPSLLHSLDLGQSQIVQKPDWRQNVSVVSAIVGPVIAAIALLGLQRPILATVLAVVGGGVAVFAIANWLIHLLRAVLRRRQQMSIQFRRAAVVVRAAELAAELLKGGPNESKEQLTGLMVGVTSTKNENLSSRLNLCIDALKAVAELILSRGVTVGLSLEAEVALSEEANALRGTVNNLHGVVVAIVRAWHDEPPQLANKDAAYPPYTRYATFINAYRENSGGWDLWASHSPVGMSEESLPPFAR